MQTTTVNPTKFIYFGWQSVNPGKRVGYGKAGESWYQITDNGRGTAQAAKVVAEAKVPGKHLVAADEVLVLH